MTQEMNERQLRRLLILFFLLLSFVFFRVFTAHADNATTSTLPFKSHVTVFVDVDNTGGGTKQPSDFVVTVTGSYPTPSWSQGNATGTTVWLNPYDTFVPYVVTVHSQPNYVEAIDARGSCGPNTVPEGGSVNCMVTERYVGPSPAAAIASAPAPATTPGIPNTGITSGSDLSAPIAANTDPTPEVLGASTTTALSISDIETLLGTLLERLTIIRNLLAERLNAQSR